MGKYQNPLTRYGTIKNIAVPPEGTKDKPYPVTPDISTASPTNPDTNGTGSRTHGVAYARITDRLWGFDFVLWPDRVSHNGTRAINITWANRIAAWERRLLNDQLIGSPWWTWGRTCGWALQESYEIILFLKKSSRAMFLFTIVYILHLPHEGHLIWVPIYILGSQVWRKLALRT